MNLYRLAQVAGVIIAGVGIGLMFAEPDARGGLWAAFGLLLFAGGRLIPWLRKRD